MIPADVPCNNLIAHAKLWVFAECYDILTLQQLSLFKLHRDLCAFKVGSESTKAFVDVLGYAYSNTADHNGEKELTEGKYGLRELVLAYAVCHADALVEIEDFMSLLQGTPGLVRDFTKALTKRKL